MSMLLGPAVLLTWILAIDGGFREEPLGENRWNYAEFLTGCLGFFVVSVAL